MVFTCVYLCVPVCTCVYLCVFLRSFVVQVVVTRSKPLSLPRINEERDRARNSRRAWGAILKSRRVCRLCDIRFTSEVNGIAHFRGKAHARKIEEKEGPYRCTDCAFVFLRKNELNQHMLSKSHIRKQLELAQNKKTTS